MPDSKISELTELGENDIATADEVAIVDTTAGQTKRFTWASIRNAVASFYDSATRTITGKTWGDNLDMGANKIVNVADPTDAQDAATKNYVDTSDIVKASSYLLALAQDTPDLTLKVLAGQVYFGGTLVEFSQANTSSFSVPVSDDRIDILSLSSAGSLVITEGTEDASPTVPSVPAGNIPIAQVYMRAGATSVQQDDDATNGYVQKDLRPFLRKDAWVVLAKTKLSSQISDANLLDLQNIDPGFRHFRITMHVNSAGGAGADALALRLNNDSGANYNVQQFTVQSTTVAGAASSGVALVELNGAGIASGEDYFTTIEFSKANANMQARGIVRTVDTAGIFNSYFEWTNVADLIDQITILIPDGDVDAGTEIIIEGLASADNL